METRLPMANCVNCSAPLPLHTTVCAYCRTRNDIDLRGNHTYTKQRPELPRICPRCANPMPTINLAGDPPFYIERCETCYGLFFDPGELDAVLQRPAATAMRVDNQRLQAVAREFRHDEYPVGYIKCPLCAGLMNRLNFSGCSGVIVDWCKDHGVWLDGGELRHLTEWVAAGGMLLARQKDDEKKRLEELRKKDHETVMTQAYADFNTSGAGRWWSDGASEPDLLGLLVRAAGRMFFS
jgi:Zn-finger nucleic acid-binding protein